VNSRIKVFSAAEPSLISQAVCPPLSNRLETLGYVIENDVCNADYLICFNHDQAVYDAFRESGGAKENTTLIRIEPAAVYPAQYRTRIEALYEIIATPGSLISNSLPFIPWPYYFNQNPLKPDSNSPDLEIVLSKALRSGRFDIKNWINRPMTLTLIASNKVSSIKNNNYKIRRELVRALPKEVLSVYGSLWDSDFKSRFIHRLGVLRFAIRSRVFPNPIELYGNFFRNYISSVGTVPDKHQVISNSRFSLVIENDNNYVSEKLIDAFLGSSVPIYFGGDLEISGIPSHLVFSNFKNSEEILDFIRKFSESDALQYQYDVLKWLKSPAFLSIWAGDKVFATIADEIVLRFRKAVN
jgi:hypothetical protein